MDIEYKYRISQDEMNYLYKSAKKRMDNNSKWAEKYINIINKCSYFKTEKKALDAAIELIKKTHSDYQIWVMFKKNNEIFQVQNHWILTDDWEIKLAAEYIGMALMYDNERLNRIIDNNVKIDDVVAYW